MSFWNAALSATSFILTPAFSTLAFNSSSRAAQSSRCFLAALIAAWRTISWSSGDSASQLVLATQMHSGMIRCWVSE